MTKHLDAKHSIGIMSRLASNQEGNIIAIFAVAIISAIALVGGAVDMSRLYLTQVRLQGACDAGALLGRKTMGTGTWTANAGAANAQAISMFNQNFESGAYGSSGLTLAYTEEGGDVFGTASVIVPMTLMQALGVGSKSITVNCQSELRIPNSDVMFVLDTTGSMLGTLPGSNVSKISGLRQAAKCFYEALVKQNIADIAPAECGETSDPSNTNIGNVQLRFGFVPYAMNVNVGKLLPQDYLADEWTYQSREAIMERSFVYGTEGTQVTTNTVVTSPANTAWTNTNSNIVQNGQTFAWYTSNITPSSACTDKAKPSDFGTTEVGNRIYVSRTPDPLSQSDSTVTRNYIRDTVSSTLIYRWFHSASNECILQVMRSAQTRTRDFISTVTPISWTNGNVFEGWKYKPTTFNVSALKQASGQWASSVSLPLGTNGMNLDVPWAGCIEERETVKANDNNPFDDWSPIQESALDMNIELTPTSDIRTKWGPYLPGTVWERYIINTDTDGVQTLTNTRTLADVTINPTTSIMLPRPQTNCPSPARLVQAWQPTEFSNYLNAINPNGFTYHDIGLLWGARLLSPTGIFSTLNRSGCPSSDNLRHMVV